MYIDALLPARYSAKSLAGKQVCKRELLAAMGLPAAAMDRPLLGVISRFASQKGFDLIAEILDQLIEEDLYLVALGTGDKEYEDLFRDMAEAHPGKIAVRIGFDNPLAHKIEAGADMFLMPSRYEPCGLNQMYSLRYGTVPIVRATGGLDDTIKEDTGFKFREYAGGALLDAIREACTAWQDPQRWTFMMRRGMEQDFSWKVSAAKYSSLYDKIARVRG